MNAQTCDKCGRLTKDYFRTCPACHSKNIELRSIAQEFVAWMNKEGEANFNEIAILELSEFYDKFKTVLEKK